MNFTAIMVITFITLGCSVRCSNSSSRKFSSIFLLEFKKLHVKLSRLSTYKRQRRNIEIHDCT